MSSKNPYDAIRADLVAGLAYPVLDWEDTESELEESEAAFLALEDDFSAEETASIGSPGSNLVRETGALRVHIFTPAESGLDAARLIGEEIRDRLRFSQLSAPGGTIVEIKNCDPPSPGMLNEALWNSKIVGVAYQYDTTG